MSMSWLQSWRLTQVANFAHYFLDLALLIGSGLQSKIRRTVTWCIGSVIVFSTLVIIKAAICTSIVIQGLWLYCCDLEERS